LAQAMWPKPCWRRRSAQASLPERSGLAACSAMIGISVSTMGGASSVDVEGAATDSVGRLRARIAEALAVPLERLGLVGPGGEALPEEGAVGEVFQDGAQITAVRMACNVRLSEYEQYIKFEQKNWTTWASKRGAHVEFPASTGLNVNMMPFVVADEASLPEELCQYWPMIMECCNLIDDMVYDPEEIYFLTIQETDVQEGTSQRRPGLHVDRHSPDTPGPGGQIRWGDVIGGIFLASSVANSTRVWPCRVDPAVIGDLGSVEHLRDHLGKGEDLGAGELVWLTDVTPHESMPLPREGPRQFFRLVTSRVSHWYAQHSTPNPLGVQPDPKITRVVHGDKFAAA